MTHDSHLEAVEIRRFRGLSEFQLDGLGRFNVLLGANDVGKTSVLEAMYLLAGFANPGLPFRLQVWRNLPATPLDHCNVLFPDLDMDQPIHLVGDSAGPIARRELTISAPRIEFEFGPASPPSADSGNGGSPTPRIAGGSGDRSSSLIPAGERLLRYQATVQPREGEGSEFTATLRMDGTKAQVETSQDVRDQDVISARFFSPHPGYDVQAIGDLVVRKQASELVRFLKNVNPRVRDIAVSGEIAYLDTGLDRMLPLNVFGGGMVRAASILSHCIRGGERVLLVDELENGLHHAAIRPLLETLLVLSREREMQVFVTTHSMEVLKSLHDVLGRDAFHEHRPTTHCFTLQRDREGRVRPYRYEYEQFRHCVSRGIEIR